MVNPPDKHYRESEGERVKLDKRRAKRNDKRPVRHG